MSLFHVVFMARNKFDLPRKRIDFQRAYLFNNFEVFAAVSIIINMNINTTNKSLNVLNYRFFFIILYETYFNIFYMFHFDCRHNNDISIQCVRKWTKLILHTNYWLNTKLNLFTYTTLIVINNFISYFIQKNNTKVLQYF